MTMKLLLDECVPRRLKRDLIDFDVVTVQEAGFAGLKNGRLINAAHGRFDILITVDKNIRHQQNIDDLAISIVVLSAATNKYEPLQPLVRELTDRLTEIKPGEIAIIEKSD